MEGRYTVKNEYIYEQKDFECFVAYELGDFLHMHNEVELLYIYKGKIRAFCNFKEYIVNENEFIIIFPNTIHAFEPIEETKYLLSIFKKGTFPTMASAFANYCIKGDPVIAKKDLHEEVDFCLNQIHDRPEIQVKCNVTIAYLMVVVDNILRNISLTPLSEEKNLDWIHKVLDYLNQNYQSQIKLDDISKELGISKYHLSRSFNARVGCSINEYTNRLRVTKARRLIESTDMQVTHIALECGFDSLATFFRAFKSLGVGSPKKYRELCEQNKLNKINSNI